MKNYAILIIQIFVSLLIIAGCIKEKTYKRISSFNPEKEIKIDVTEPSGLCLTFDGTGLWTVSDEDSGIYRLDLEGNVINQFKVNGFDLEGITVIDEERIAVILERTREVVILETSGNELKRTKLPFEGELNSGLEGITYDPILKTFYLLNEKKPSLLIKLDEELNLISIDTLNFAKDVSGIFYDPENFLWILSDESQVIVKTDLDGNELDRYEVSIPQPEGITIDKEKKNLFIVSDNSESLYIFKLE